MNKKIMCYAGVVFLLLFVGSSSALIDLTGTYQIDSGSNIFNQDLNTTDSPTFVDLTVTDDIDVADDMYIADKIYHRGDEDTYIRFMVDQYQWFCGGIPIVGFRATEFIVNVDGMMGNRDIDFVVEGDGIADLFFVDAGLGRIGIGTYPPDQLLDVDGNVNITGDLNITGITNSSGGFATDTGVGWSGTFTATEGVVTVRQGIIVDVDWD